METMRLFQKLTVTEFAVQLILVTLPFLENLKKSFSEEMDESMKFIQALNSE